MHVYTLAIDFAQEVAKRTAAQLAAEQPTAQPTAQLAADLTAEFATAQAEAEAKTEAAAIEPLWERGSKVSFSEKERERGSIKPKKDYIERKGRKSELF